MAGDSTKTYDWIRYPRGVAQLKLIRSSEGKLGRVLNTGKNEAARKVREGAIEAGFWPSVKNPHVLVYYPDQTDSRIGIRRLARMTGGDVVTVTQKDLVEGMIRVPAKPVTMPDKNSVRVIGLNLHGEEIVADERERYIKRKDERTGKDVYLAETAAGNEGAAAFLRITNASSYPGIAAGLVAMGQRRILHAENFRLILDAAMEPGPAGAPSVTRDEADRGVREAVLRQITSIAIEAEDRQAFLRALRVSEYMGDMLSVRTDAGDFLKPSAATLSLLRRMTQGFDAVDFRGGADLGIAVPRVKREGADLQVLDFCDADEDGVQDIVSNALSRRPREGASIILLPGDISEETLERVRVETGCTYGLESVARLASGISDGLIDGRGVYLVFAGEKRPEPLDSLPLAAMRTFNAITADDLASLEREVRRSREKIREFNRGETQPHEAVEDAREDNSRQRPYQPLSRASTPFTMIPLALEGATSKALARVAREFENEGGADAAVASRMGVSIADLGEVVHCEQIDAVALQLTAARAGRGFLLADQTGIGKGRSLAAMARCHLRAAPVVIPGPESSADSAVAVGEGAAEGAPTEEGGSDARDDVVDAEATADRVCPRRLLYFTESATINIPDVCRDLKDTGCWEGLRVGFLSAGSRVADTVIDPVTGDVRETELRSFASREQKEIFESGRWPEGYDVLITTYSKFNCAEDALPSTWISQAVDDGVMIILDEAHNALNKKSNTGRNVRDAMRQARPENVIFATGTPMRDPKGLDLYEPLLPRTADDQLSEILRSVENGGEVAQESLTTMLAEDGVFIRRDHDLSKTDFEVNLPDDERMMRYQEVMNRFSPVVEAMINTSVTISETVNQNRAQIRRDLENRGMEPAEILRHTNALSQYSMGLGGPLANIARITMNALKIDQTVEAAVSELNAGRKPLITFHSTNSALFNELSRDENGTKLSDEALSEIPELSLRDQIRRIHERIYFARLNGERTDTRTINPEVAAAYDSINALIDQLPELPVSPLDALVERLEAAGVRVGEISGRSLAYRNGRIERRDREERDRKAIIDAFNAGEKDALIYNSAGATGGSYHASPHFRDQRGRTMIELEAPTDVIKYVQSQGRGNRKGQVVDPRVVTIMTGLTPEMRIMQQRNAKLRSLGASVDGNRSHPMLLDDVPDFLNRVGDEATHNVLSMNPTLARRMGFTDYGEEEIGLDDGGQQAGDTGSSGIAAKDSLSNKVLARSLMLSGSEQTDLVNRIKMEFDVLIEELDSRNANPLKPKEFAGQVEVKATSMFSGYEGNDDDPEKEMSAFLSPLYVWTGTHHFTEKAVTAERLVAMVERAVTLHGPEGFKPLGDRIQQNLPTLLRPYLPDGFNMDAALETPEEVPGRFAQYHKKITDLAWTLENIRPGVGIRYRQDDEKTSETCVIVDLTKPAENGYYDVPSAYRMKIIAPGMSEPVSMSLSRLLRTGVDDIRFRPGLSEGMNEDFLERFTQLSRVKRQLPVQILTGNILQAIKTASENNLGTISLVRDTEGVFHRGVVVHDEKVDMERLPAKLPPGMPAAEMVAGFLAEEGARYRKMTIYGSMDGSAVTDRQGADIIIRCQLQKAILDVKPCNRSTFEYFAQRPGLHEALWQKPMPATKDDALRVGRRANTNHQFLVKLDMTSDADRRRLFRIVETMGASQLMVDGNFRPFVNDAIRRIDQGEALARVEVPIEAEATDVSDLQPREQGDRAGAGAVQVAPLDDAEFDFDAVF